MDYKIGDLIIVPTPENNSIEIGRVIKQGKLGYYHIIEIQMPDGSIKARAERADLSFLLEHSDEDEYDGFEDEE